MTMLSLRNVPPAPTRRAGRLLPAAVMLALAGCAASVTPSGTETVDESFQRTTGIFSDGASIDVAVAARERQGNLAICGAWVFTPQSVLSRAASHRAIDTGTVQVDGRPAIGRLSRFSRQPNSAPLDGALALCLRTDRAWTPDLASADVRARFPRSVFERDTDGKFRGLIFRELRSGRASSR